MHYNATIDEQVGAAVKKEEQVKIKEILPLFFNVFFLFFLFNLICF